MTHIRYKPPPPRGAGTETRRELILELMSDGRERTATEIAERLGLTSSSVGGFLSSLQGYRSGMIKGVSSWRKI